VEKLIPGAVLRSRNAFSYPGGKGINTARAASSLGLRSVAAGFCGSADIKEMNTFMKSHGVEPDFISVPGKNRLCLLIPDKNMDTVINSESCLAVKARHRAGLLNKIKNFSSSASVFVFSGSLPLCLPPDFYAACIHAAGKKAAIILDSHSEYLKKGITGRPSIVKANAAEFESAFSVKLDPFKKRAAFMRFMSRLSGKYGTRTIITTMGAKGSSLFEAGVFTYIKPFPVKRVISRTGAGDAYTAGLAFGIKKGLPMRESCRIGAAAAASGLGRMGACFISKKEVFRLV
jgi:1-phosphofructokinase family hexose kinase